MDWQGTPPVDPGTYWGAMAMVIALTALGIALNVVILRKAGRHPLWSVLFVFPLAYVIGLWVFAFTRWPNESATPSEPPLGGRPDDQPPGIHPAPNARRSFDDRRRW